MNIFLMSGAGYIGSHTAVVLAGACNGMLFSHESPLRGETFVTRNITRAISRIALGLQYCLYPGNMSALRGWPRPRLRADAMADTAQQDVAEDFVIATDLQDSVRQFIEFAALELGVTIGFTGKGAAEIGTVIAVVGDKAKCKVGDRIITRFSLLEIYNDKFQVDARWELDKNVRITAEKKENLIIAEVDDNLPARGAEITSAYIEELRELNNCLALTDVKQRPFFFEQQLDNARNALTRSQKQLRDTGFRAANLRSEPKAAAESHARTKAELTANEVKLSVLRRSRTEATLEVLQAAAAIDSLRRELARIEGPGENASGQDYTTACREYKHQELLFEIYARQYELPCLDEARDGAFIQVVDVATPLEKKSRPKRPQLAIAGFIAVLICAAAAVSVFSLRRGSLV